MGIIGTKGFAFIDNNIEPFEIQYIGNNTYAMEKDDRLIKIETRYFDESKEALEKRLKTSKMRAVCLETNRTTGELIAYAINSEVNDGLLFALHIRGRYNPELRYFLILDNNLTENILREMEESPDALIEDNIIIEL